MDLKHYVRMRKAYKRFPTKHVKMARKLNLGYPLPEPIIVVPPPEEEPCVEDDGNFFVRGVRAVFGYFNETFFGGEPTNKNKCK